MKKNFSEENAEQKELIPAAEEAAEVVHTEENSAEAAEETVADTVQDTEESAVDQSKKAAEEKPEKVHKDHRKLRYGTIATAMSVVVIAAVVLFNVVVGVLDDRFPLRRHHVGGRRRDLRELRQLRYDPDRQPLSRCILGV